MEEERREDYERLLQALRKLGKNEAQCILIIKREFGIGLAEGKQFVHFSTTFRDRLDENERLHDLFEELVMQEESRTLQDS